MSDQNDVINVLAPHETVEQDSHARAFLAGAAAQPRGASLLLPAVRRRRAPDYRRRAPGGALEDRSTCTPGVRTTTPR